MLDKIQGNNTELINQSSQLDRIKETDNERRVRGYDADYFVDESDISLEALQKYQKENEIKYFSQILMDTDEKEANSLVVKKIFDGTISTDDVDLTDNLIKNSDFLNDII